MMSRALLTMMLAVGWLGCVGQASEPDDKEGDKTGKLALQLTASDSMGREYRLRNAEFQVTNYYYYYPPSQPTNLTLSSETDPDARFIEARLFPGEYIVSLISDGWYLERLTAAGPERVEQAVLLSERTLYTYIYDGGTTDVSFTFGVDGELIDFRHGDLRIGIQVLLPGDDDDDAGVP